MIENLKPTVNKAVKKKGKLSIVAAGTNRKDPIAEIIKPAESVFVSKFCKTSIFKDTKKKIIDPTK
jgi:hypothetical protein